MYYTLLKVRNIWALLVAYYAAFSSTVYQSLLCTSLYGLYGDVSLDRVGLWPLCPKQGTNYVLACPDYKHDGIACTIDLMCQLKFVCTSNIQKQWL